MCYFVLIFLGFVIFRGRTIGYLEPISLCSTRAYLRSVALPLTLTVVVPAELVSEQTGQSEAAKASG